MHIVFLSPHSDPEAHLGEPDSGGQCLYELQLAKALSATPYTSVTIFCRQTGIRPNTTQPAPHFTVRRIPCGPARFVPKERLYPHLPTFVAQVSEELNTNPATILHSHYWDGGAVALYLLAIKNGSIPSVWTPHSLGTLKRQRFIGEAAELQYHFIPRLLWENYISLLSAKVIVSSTSEAQQLVRGYSIDQPKVKVISPGIDFSELQPIEKKVARAALKLPLKPKVIMCLGRMVPNKGYHHAIDIFAELQKLTTRPTMLVICGGAPSKATEEEKQYVLSLKEQVVQLELEGKVIFLPALPHPKIHLAYAACDVFVMPSTNEPFGLTVLEAMAMKRPVVAHNQGGPKETVVHNQTGNLVDITQSQRAAYYILTLLQDPYRYNYIVENAFDFVKKTYSWSSKASQFLEVYRELNNSRATQSLWWQARYQQLPFLKQFITMLKPQL